MTLTAFVNAHVVPVAAEPFDGTLLVEDGRITAIGPDVEAPDGAEVVDCEGRWVLPGFVDAHVHLGMHAEGEVGATADVNEMTDPVMAGVRAIDAVDPNEPGWKDALAGGVTTVNVNPGSGNPIGGQAVALHTHGRTVDEMVLRSPSGVKSALGENPKNVYKEKGRTPSTRLGTALVIREAFLRAQGYMARRAEAEREDKPFTRDPHLDALVHPLLKVARLYWLAVTVVLIGIAGAFLWNGARAQDSGEPVIDPLTGMESVGVLGGATGQFTMGTAVALLAAASLWGWIGLLRRRRSAIGTLTFIAVLLAAPAFLRANGLLIILAVVMLLGAALVWLPPVHSRLRR